MVPHTKSKPPQDTLKQDKAFSSMRSTDFVLKFILFPCVLASYQDVHIDVKASEESSACAPLLNNFECINVKQRVRLLLSEYFIPDVVTIMLEYANFVEYCLPSSVASFGDRHLWYYEPSESVLVRCHTDNGYLVEDWSTKLEVVPRKIYCNPLGNRVSVIEEGTRLLPGAEEEIRLFMADDVIDREGKIRIFRCKARGVGLPYTIAFLSCILMFGLAFILMHKGMFFLLAVLFLPCLVNLGLFKIFQDEPLHHEDLLYREEYYQGIDTQIQAKFHPFFNLDNPSFSEKVPNFLHLRTILGMTNSKFRKCGGFCGLKTFILKGFQVVYVFARNKKVVLNSRADRVCVLEANLNGGYSFEFLS